MRDASAFAIRPRVVVRRSRGLIRDGVETVPTEISHTFTPQHLPEHPSGLSSDHGRRGSGPYRARGQDSVFPIFGQWIWSDQGELGRDAGLT